MISHHFQLNVKKYLILIIQQSPSQLLSASNIYIFFFSAKCSHSRGKYVYHFYDIFKKRIHHKLQSYL